jgi:hypothetical protein
MGVDEDSASLSQIIAASKCFSVIKGWGMFGLTDLSNQYFSPADDTEKRKAILKIIKAPSVFEKLIEKYDGSKLPANEMVANLVEREMGVPPSWKARVASLFVSALKQVNAIDAAGFIRYGAAVHAAENSSADNSSNGEEGRQESKTQQPKDPLERNRVIDTSSSGDDRIMIALLAKFPEFDPSWGAEQQAAWFSAYEKLIGMNIKKVGEK